MPDEPTSPPPEDPKPTDPPKPAEPTTPPAAKADGDEPLGEAGTKALEAMKARARDAEKEAKAAKAALEKLQRESLDEQQKAIADARDEGKSEATKAAGERLAAAEIRAALTNLVPDPAGIVEDLNLGKYVGDDGEPDQDAIKALASKYAALGVNKKPSGVPGGPRGDAKAPSLDEAYAAAMAAGKTRDAIRIQTRKLLDLPGQSQ